MLASPGGFNIICQPCVSCLQCGLSISIYNSPEGFLMGMGLRTTASQSEEVGGKEVSKDDKEEDFMS